VFICYLVQGKAVSCAILYSDGLVCACLLALGLLSDRLVLYTSENSNIVYYRLSLMSLTCCSSLVYSLTSSGNRLTANSIHCVLGNPSSLDSQSRLSLNTGSVLMVNVLSLMGKSPCMYIILCMYIICMYIFVCTEAMYVHYLCMYKIVITGSFSLYVHNISTIWGLSRANRVYLSMNPYVTL